MIAIEKMMPFFFLSCNSIVFIKKYVINYLMNKWVNKLRFNELDVCE